jgi:GNAT superfamily N-acetyltransferase
MNKELFFLRSSEQSIVSSMLKYAYDENMVDLNKYSDYYGLTAKDLGLYALVDNKIAGAIWSRELNNDRETPFLSVAVVPEFKSTDIASFMMEQFLLEAAVLYDQIKINITHKPDVLKFYEDFGFEKIDDSFILIKKLQRQEIVRPKDNYDPTRWID